ncbi:MAG: hypothetical protein AAF456_05275 [Planctomycetota bacterium]
MTTGFLHTRIVSSAAYDASASDVRHHFRDLDFFVAAAFVFAEPDLPDLAFVFFSPKALAQLFEYFFVEPDLKIVILVLPQNYGHSLTVSVVFD